MRFSAVFATAALALVANVVVDSAHAREGDGNRQTAGHYLVTAQDPESARGAVRRAGGRVIEALGTLPTVRAALSPTEYDLVRQMPGMRVYRDGLLHLSQAADTADGVAPSPIGHTLLARAAALHTADLSGKGVTVAVIDTGLGVSAEHALGERVLATVDATTFPVRTSVGGQGDFDHLDDHNGHGSHVSGTILSDDEASGVSRGIAPAADLVAIRAFGAQGLARYVDVIRAIDWVIGHREEYAIRVLNLSFSAPPRSPYWDDPLNQAVMAAWQAGIVVVTSAGNGGPNPMTIGVPGNVPYVITVGAVTDAYTPFDLSDDRLTSFSAAGPTHEGFIKPDVVAPGGHVSAWMPHTAVIAAQYAQFADQQDEYFTMTGTSQSAAVTSGVVALMLEAEPTLTPDEVKCRLMASAHVATREGEAALSVFQQGAGLIDALGAVSSHASGCANVGLDIQADLTGTRHFGGPVGLDADGTFYVRAANGEAIATNGYTWSRGDADTFGYTWSQDERGTFGYTWSQPDADSFGYTWSQDDADAFGYTWSQDDADAFGYTWSQDDAGSFGYTWSQDDAGTFGYTWSQDDAGTFGYTWSQDDAGTFGYTWSQDDADAFGYTWSQGDAEIHGYTWSQGFPWSEDGPWIQGYTWSQGDAWSETYPWAERSVAAAINGWVPQE